MTVLFNIVFMTEQNCMMDLVALCLKHIWHSMNLGIILPPARSNTSNCKGGKKLANSQGPLQQLVVGAFMSKEQIMVSFIWGYFWAITAQEEGYCFWLPLPPSLPGSTYTAEWSCAESVFAGQSLDQVQPQFFSVTVEVHSCTYEWNLKIEIKKGGIFL